MKTGDRVGGSSLDLRVACKRRVSAEKRREVARAGRRNETRFVEGQANLSAFFPVSGRGGLGPQAMADPEHRVIGQVSPSQFPALTNPRRENFRSPIFLDPGVEELRHFAALTIECSWPIQMLLACSVSIFRRK